MKKSEIEAQKTSERARLKSLEDKDSPLDKAEKAEVANLKASDIGISKKK